MSKTSREVEHIINGREVSDGAGVRLLRVLTADLQRRLDPFLMLDEFRSDNPDDYIAGFPSHPHRGFETITYMLAGRMRHRDNAGNEGLLGPGGVQWMTAGRGIVHSELPEQEDGLMHGFQLWLNLPAERKLCEPWYRDIPAAEIPSAPAQGEARLIAGHWRDQAGAMEREATGARSHRTALPGSASGRRQ
ncbi:pirin family protein [Chromobacterium piscinae]|uniref:pirin family protein n=1 Tax=Chromobacterium piscinae TaxID=686831 RepID=UPI0031FE15B9